MVNKINSSGKIMRPKNEWKRGIRKKREVGSNTMTIKPFEIVIMICEWGSSEMKDTLGSKKICKGLVFISIIRVKNDDLWSKYFSTRALNRMKTSWT